MAARACDVCGTTYEAKRATSKYCSARCRVRAAERRSSGVAPVVPLIQSVSAEGGLYAATLKQLEAAEMVDSALGQAALILARRLDNPNSDTGSSVAAVIREHRVTLQSALDSGKVAADPLDELAARRRERRAGS